MPEPMVRSTEDEALHREMERISLDWCMVYNPTDEDFYIEWAAKDGRPWKYLVPNRNKDIGWGQGKLEVQRYLAIWYCKHMKDKIINEKGQQEGEKILAKRREEGKADLTKFEEQKAIWDKSPRTTSEKELASLYPILFLGISREFGIDYTPSAKQMVDQTTTEEKAFENIQNKKYAPEVIKPIETIKVEPSVSKEESKIPKRKYVEC